MRGDIDDIRSYRYRIISESGDRLAFGWKRTRDYLVALFMAIDGQLAEQATLNAENAMRIAVNVVGNVPIHDDDLNEIKGWMLCSVGDADCGHRTQHDECACCLRTQGRMERS